MKHPNRRYIETETEVLTILDRTDGNKEQNKIEIGERSGTL